MHRDYKIVCFVFHATEIRIWIVFTTNKSGRAGAAVSRANKGSKNLLENLCSLASDCKHRIQPNDDCRVNVVHNSLHDSNLFKYLFVQIVHEHVESAIGNVLSAGEHPTNKQHSFAYEQISQRVEQKAYNAIAKH